MHRPTGAARLLSSHAARRGLAASVATGVAAQLRKVMETSTPIMEGMVEAETPARPGAARCAGLHPA